MNGRNTNQVSEANALCYISSTVMEPFGYTGMPSLQIMDTEELFDALFKYVFPDGKPSGTKEELQKMLSRLFDDIRKFNTKLTPEFLEDALYAHGAKDYSCRIKETSISVIYYTDFTYAIPEGGRGRYRYATEVEK